MNRRPVVGWWRTIKQAKPVRLLAQTATEWYEDKALELGAALAYYAVFSISPIILLSVAVASMFLGKGAAEGRIEQQIKNSVGPTVAEAIQGTLAYSYRRGSGEWATLIGIVILILAAMGFFSQLQSALNKIWKVRPKPGRGLWGTLRDRFMSFVAVLGACLLLLASLLVSATLSAVVHALPASEMSARVHLWQTLTLCGFFVLLTLAMALILQYLPDVIIAWRDVWIGAAASAAMVILGNHLISLYLRWSGTSAAYGAAGSFVVVLLWAYYSAQILLFGAEFTQVHVRSRGKPIEPTENAEWATAAGRAPLAGIAP
jgi:membrane protein